MWPALAVSPKGQQVQVGFHLVASSLNNVPGDVNCMDMLGKLFVHLDTWHPEIPLLSTSHLHVFFRLYEANDNG